MTNTKHAVVIAGGGPTGLMLAGELALARVDVTIVERRVSQDLAGSRAGGLHARTIEVLDQRGIADRFLAQGQTSQLVAFAASTLDLRDFPTRHNYTLALWQDRIERTLAAWVDELAVPILRGLEVTSFVQDATGVDVALSDGRSLRAQYLVGCDGGRSRIRKLAGIDFPGWDPSVRYLIAEAETADEPALGVVREVLVLLEPARKLANPTNDLYEMSIGLSGLTAVEDSMRGSKDADELLRRASVTLTKLRELNEEHRKLAPERAAMLDVALDLAKDAISKGPDFADHMSTMLARASIQARGVAAKYPKEPNARKLAITLAVFAPDATDAAAYVLTDPPVPDDLRFIVTRAEIALDLGKSIDDAGIVSRARALVVENIRDPQRDPRVLALLGDVEVESNLLEELRKARSLASQAGVARALGFAFKFPS